MYMFIYGFVKNKKHCTIKKGITINDSRYNTYFFVLKLCMNL